VKKTALRTDDFRFANLPGYPFTPHYLYVHHPDYEALRMHFVDEDCAGQNKTENVTLLLLHGCPSWSFLYRKVITALLNPDAGNSPARIIAPDFIGCGKSDKLLARSDYSYDFYVSTLRQFIEQLNLKRIILVCQDWGGPVGLRVCSEIPERFTAVIASNTLLPNCEAAPLGVENWPGDIINNWVQYTKNASDIVISQVMQGVTVTKLPADILAAYDAPFPDARYKQGMLGWPALIPLTENSAGIKENRKTWTFLENSVMPFVTAYSDKDPSTADWEKIFQQRVKGAKNRKHPKILNAGHMVQEDNAEALAAVIRSFLALPG
jgi:haloalkane dehalogenase